MQLAQQSHAYFLFGTVAETAENAPLNSAVLLRPDGTLVDRYDKINLVPFGEFVPKIFGFVNRITQEAGDFAPGNRIVVFPWATGSGWEFSFATNRYFPMRCGSSSKAARICW